MFFGQDGRRFRGHDQIPGRLVAAEHHLTVAELDYSVNIDINSNINRQRSVLNVIIHSVLLKLSYNNIILSTTIYIYYYVYVYIYIYL